VKFGVFYEHQIPRPWDESSRGSEYQQFQNALDQVELADELGYDYAWQTEHHFTEEYSHASAPEVFLAAASQRTKHIRLGHGIVQVTTNQPQRVAEKIATLDLISSGRVEFGVGEAATTTELHPFGVRFRDKREVFEEAVHAILPMFTDINWEFHGKYFDFPARNVIPKPYQKPFPPLWLACSSLETIAYAASMGMGALGFQFVSPEGAEAWVNRYYTTISGELSQLVEHPINPNIGMVCGFMCCDTDEEAQRKAEGWDFFSFSLGYYHQHNYPEPGTVNMWDLYLQWKEDRRAQGKPPTPGLIGSPETIRQMLRGYANAHVDQVILLNQAGKNQHEDICSSLELFAREVMPEFQEQEDAHQVWKADVLNHRIELEEMDTSSHNRWIHQPKKVDRPDLSQLKPELEAKDAGRAS
jgi:alkanesulfonate monooxygenase SsuD/methylene tetrahydromethanopterin reductase-like flavin-dependent oxidoreductase (luciferase family)